MLPGVTRRALFLCMNAAGSALSNLAMADSAMLFRFIGIFRHYIQQIDGDTGVGNMGGDTGTHDPGTNHRNFLDVPSDSLQNSRYALPAADALGGEGKLLVFPFQQTGGFAGNSGT